jgi:predicted GIY-YIG superfamily endonuclease
MSALSPASFGGRGPLPDATWHVYILRCNDDSYYVGKTKNLEDRLSHHATRQVSYTSTRLPVELLTWISFTDEWKAVLMEKYLKSGSGRAFMKRHLI